MISLYALLSLSLTLLRGNQKKQRPSTSDQEGDSDAATDYSDSPGPSNKKNNKKTTNGKKAAAKKGVGKKKGRKSKANEDDEDEDEEMEDSEDEDEDGGKGGKKGELNETVRTNLDSARFESSVKKGN